MFYLYYYVLTEPTYPPWKDQTKRDEMMTQLSAAPVVNHSHPLQ